MTNKNASPLKEADVTANIIVMGKSGVDKSTLINAVLSKKKAKQETVKQ